MSDFEKLGFADNQELNVTKSSAKKFFIKFGDEFSIRKANSTKTSIRKPSKDE